MSDPTSREPQQDRSRATRSRLLEAAVACLADVGYSGATVAMVAELAGVSRGAAQHHFPTREALFVAAVEHVANERSEEIRRQMVTCDGRRVTTHQVVEMIIDTYAGTLFRAALALWVASASAPDLREQVVPLEARIGRQVHRVTVELLGVDESQPGVREIVQATLDMARGLGLANLLTDDSARREGIASEWARILDSTLASVGGGTPHR